MTQMITDSRRARTLGVAIGLTALLISLWLVQQSQIEEPTPSIGRQGTGEDSAPAENLSSVPLVESTRKEQRVNEESDAIQSQGAGDRSWTIHVTVVSANSGRGLGGVPLFAHPPLVPAASTGDTEELPRALTSASGVAELLIPTTLDSVWIEGRLVGLHSVDERARMMARRPTDDRPVRIQLELQLGLEHSTKLLRSHNRAPLAYFDVQFFSGSHLLAVLQSDQGGTLTVPEAILDEVLECRLIGDHDFLRVGGEGSSVNSTLIEKTAIGTLRAEEVVLECGPTLDADFLPGAEHVRCRLKTRGVQSSCHARVRTGTNGQKWARFRTAPSEPAEQGDRMFAVLASDDWQQSCIAVLPYTAEPLTAPEDILWFEPATLEGRVIDGEGVAVPYAIVHFEWIGLPIDLDGFTESISCDDRGHFSQHLMRGEIRIAAKNAVGRFDQIVTVNGVHSVLDIVLESPPGGPVEGVLVGVPSDQVENIVVVLRRLNDPTGLMYAATIEESFEALDGWEVEFSFRHVRDDAFALEIHRPATDDGPTLLHALDLTITPPKLDVSAEWPRR